MTMTDTEKWPAGPWQSFVEDDGARSIETEQQQIIAVVPYVGCDQTICRSHLIAAAPELALDNEVLAKAADKRAKDHAIPDSDLDDEQPVHIVVTLGDLRRARRTYRKARGEQS